MRMKNFKLLCGFILSVAALVLGGGSMAAAVTATNGTPVTTLEGGAAGETQGAGVAIESLGTLTNNSDVTKQMDNSNFYLNEINQKICEMKQTSTPIDQILRNATSHTTKSISVKNYKVGQRPLTAKLTTAITGASLVAATSNLTLTGLNANIFKPSDTLEIINADGTFVTGANADGNTNSSMPLLLRVVSVSESGAPIVIAMNGYGADGVNGFALSDADSPLHSTGLTTDMTFIRLGAAAAELDVQAGAYYNLPSSTIQYCQRFIMQCEDSLIERISAKEVPWQFTDVERMSLEDMRIGMEGSGLFGVKSVVRYDGQGDIHTQGGIWWSAGKDVSLGKWVDSGNKNAAGKSIYNLEISEDDLVDFVSEVIDGAGNGSRTKVFFVDNKLYEALAKIKTNKQRILSTVNNFQNWGLDFEGFESMGTKLLVYRHDLFNAYGMEYKGFVLDAQYLDKWVFQPMTRREVDLREKLIRNSNAVIIEEFSCWTLQFPNAHARIAAPTLSVTDAVKA